VGIGTVLALGIGSYVLRAIGLAAFSAGQLPGWAVRLIRLVPPAILAALIVGLVVDPVDGLRADASLVGVIVGVILLRLRAPLAVALLTAAAVTAAIRAVA
jgi:branched-subunit amino acid transport protein